MTNGQRTLKDMKITKDEVLYVAHLARLDLDAESIEKFAGQIDEILGYIEKLNQLDTQNIKPTSHAIFLTNAFREDQEREHIERELALANAPEKEDGSFVVPKVVG
jgi:aspartyl-tRNA(Asn)/glutamyl-tRNA(Gln) amidotransferase subunit C